MTLPSLVIFDVVEEHAEPARVQSCTYVIAISTSSPAYALRSIVHSS